jgi:uncharacterized damage-inducible protein DinB
MSLLRTSRLYLLAAFLAVFAFGGDIVRHLAACELMFVGAVADGVWRYPGHDREVAPTLPLALAHLDAGHARATAQLRGLADGALQETRPPLEPGARPVRAWRLLLAMTEHEVHHRSQIDSYAGLEGWPVPDIFGRSAESIDALQDSQRLKHGAGQGA